MDNKDEEKSTARMRNSKEAEIPLIIIDITEEESVEGESTSNDKKKECPNQ